MSREIELYSLTRSELEAGFVSIDPKFLGDREAGVSDIIKSLIPNPITKISLDSQFDYFLELDAMVSYERPDLLARYFELRFGIAVESVGYIGNLNSVYLKVQSDLKKLYNVRLPLFPNSEKLVTDDVVYPDNKIYYIAKELTPPISDLYDLLKAGRQQNLRDNYICYSYY